MKQKYKHLTQDERYSIERMRKAGYKQNAIAELLDRSEGTISREIRRNMGKRGYRSGQAGDLAAQRRLDSRKAKRFTAAVQQAVESYLQEDYSPEQVTGFMRRQGEDTEYTDAIWVYWSKDPNHWKAEDKAVVLDPGNCTWAKRCIGMPAVVPHDGKLAILYDALEGEKVHHMGRDIGLCWLDLPLQVPGR